MDHLTDDIEQSTYEPSEHRVRRSYVFYLLYAAQAHEYEYTCAALADMLCQGFECVIPPEAVEQAQVIVDQRDQIDARITPLLSNWRLDRIGLCTHLVLRFSVHELYTNYDDSINLIINEGVELAKCFSEKDAYKFVNGVLDEAAKQLGREPLPPADGDVQVE